MSKHLSLNVSDQLYSDLILMQEGEESVQDVVRRLLTKATEYEPIQVINPEENITPIPLTKKERKRLRKLMRKTDGVA